MNGLRQKLISGLLAFLMILSVFSNFAYADETLRVDLSIINFDGSTITHDTDFWVNKTIPAAANVKISGSGVSIKNPWIVLTVPKNGGRVEKPTFVDSQNSYETKRLEDEENWYVIYKFRELTGGNLMTFQFPFKFREEPTRNGDTEIIKLDMVDANDESIDFKNMPKLYSTTKTYKALKNEFEYSNSAIHPYGYNRFDDTTKIYHYNVNTLEGQNTTGEPGRDVEVGFSEVVEVTKGFDGTVSFVKPTNLKIVVHLPEGVEPAEAYKRDWIYDPVAKTATFIDNNPAPNYYHSGRRDGNPGRTYWPHFVFKNKALDTPYDISAEYYVDAGLPTQRKFSDRAMKVQFKGIPFSPTGGLFIHKDNLNGAGTDPIKFDIADGNYAIHDGVIYDRKNDQTAEGLVYQTTFRNSNNGSSFDNKKNGIVTKLFNMGDVLSKQANDKRVYYKYYQIKDFYKDGDSYTDAEFKTYKENVINQLNSGNTLYGIKDDGTREVIRENVQFEEKVDINDTEGKYKALDLVLKEPIILDDAGFRIVTHEFPSKAELEKFANKTYKTKQTYGGRATATSTSDFLNKINDDQKANNTHNGDYAYTSLSPIEPKSDISATGDQQVSYSKSGTFVNYATEGRFRADYGLWGPLVDKPIENVKVIQLLPPAFNYASTNSAYWYNGEKIGAPEVIENFKNTGRTAVIYTVPKVLPSDIGLDDFGISTRVEVSPYAKRGANQIDSYIVYPDNKNIVSFYNQRAYKDDLDLDGDGDREEYFMGVSSNITYTPPLELLIKKEVGFTKDSLGLVATGDLGEDFYYNISIFNNTIEEASSAYVIDKLPYAQDTVIVPNQANEYLKRGSVFNTPLSGAIEDAPENAAVLEKFDIFYQVGPRDTIENVRDGQWVTKDQVNDFSKVTSFKFVLKEGKQIAVKETVNFLVKSKIPYDKTLSPGDFAINSSAISTDSNIFVEGNKVKVTFEKYLVTGKYFKDFNKDGNLSTREDGVSGRKVELIDADTGAPVKDAEGNFITATTDASGRYTMSVYKRGNYKVRFTRDDTDVFTDNFGKKIDQNNVEEKPEGTNYGMSHSFVLNPISNSAIINAGIVSVNRDVEILKTSSEADENGIKKALSGVEFKLMKGEETVDTVETDATGKAVFKNIPFGEYKIVETKALEGYDIIEKNGRDVTVGEDDLEVQTIENKPIKRNITFVKIDGDNEDETTNKLSGVKFGLFKENDLNTPIFEATSNQDGVVTFENVSYGQYKIKEIETLEGYALSDMVKSVNITENGDDAISLGNWINNKIKSDVQVKKVDGDDNTKVLSGVVFSLNKDGNEIATATTDDKGIATFENVVFGEYTITEKTPKEGYLPSDITLNVNVDTDGETINAGIVSNIIKKGHIRLTKVDADNQQIKLKGVEFSLKKVEGNKKTEVATAKTDVDGVALFEDVPYGDYIVVEKATLDNYVLDDTERPISITEDQVTEDLGTVSNKMKKGSVTFKKVDADDSDKALVNVTFELRQNNQKKYEAVSKNDGTVTFEDVVYGEYKLVETGTLDNYNLPEENAFESTDISITQDKQIINLGEISNQIKKGNVKVTKVDAEDKDKKLAGVTFVLMQADKEVYEATTGEDGVATFEGVVYGDYTLKEKSTLENYNLSEEIRDVSIRKDGELIDLGDFTNQIKKGSVKVTKVDADNKDKKLEGVTFVLMQTDKEVYEATTGEDGVATFEDIVYGDYTLKEKSTLENYNLSEEIRDVSIRKEGELIDLGDFTNQIKKGSVKVTKVDAYDKDKKLAGVTFVLMQDDKEVYEATTGEDGVATFEDILYGDYQLKEKSTLENYNLSEEIRDVSIRKDGELVDLEEFYNTLKKGTIIINKVDEKGNKLQGVEFALIQNDKIIDTKVTDANGVVAFEDLVYGDYKVKETKELKGFFKNDKTYEFSIRENGKVLEETVLNKKIPVKAPKTGDNMDLGILASLLCASLGLFVVSRKKVVK